MEHIIFIYFYENNRDLKHHRLDANVPKGTFKNKKEDNLVQSYTTVLKEHAEAWSGS